jgi:hypothetical protein
MTSVTIFGAGVSGLAAAHELANAGGFEVTIVEKKSSVGGLARSSRTDVNKVPTEYSWRGYGPWYHNVYQLMKQIPFGGASVFEQLSRPITFKFVSSRGNDVFDTRLTLWDKLVVFYFVLRVAYATQSARDRLSTMNASSTLKPLMSSEGHQHFISSIGPWIGIDPKLASMFHVFHFYYKGACPGPAYEQNDENGSWKTGVFEKWSVLRRPTSEAWFEPWKQHLLDRGVQFVMKTSLEKIECDDNVVKEAVVEDEEGTRSIVSDFYIVATSPFELQRLTRESALIERTMLEGLVKNVNHIQMSFRIGFPFKVQWPDSHVAFILVNSPYNITFYSQDTEWHADVFLGEDIATLWSCTACVSYVRGMITAQEMAALSNPDDFQNEVMTQMFSDSEFVRIFPQLRREDVTHFEIWKEWKFCDDGVFTEERKWVDTTGTRRYEPRTQSSLSNLFFAGAHTRTATELWSMEGAAESGRRAADALTLRASAYIRRARPNLQDYLRAIRPVWSKLSKFI